MFKRALDAPDLAACDPLVHSTLTKLLQCLTLTTDSVSLQTAGRRLHFLHTGLTLLDLLTSHPQSSSGALSVLSMHGKECLSGALQGLYSLGELCAAKEVVDLTRCLCVVKVVNALTKCHNNPQAKGVRSLLSTPSLHQCVSTVLRHGSDQRGVVTALKIVSSVEESGLTSLAQCLTADLHKRQSSFQDGAPRDVRLTCWEGDVTPLGDVEQLAANLENSLRVSAADSGQCGGEGGGEVSSVVRVYRGHLDQLVQWQTLCETRLQHRTDEIVALQAVLTAQRAAQMRQLTAADQVARQLAAAEQQRAEVADRERQLTAQCSQLNAQLEQHEHHLQEYRQKVSQGEKRLSKSEKELKDALKGIEKLQQSLAEETNKAKHLKTELDAAQVTCRRSEAALASREASFQSMKKQLESEAVRLRKEVASLQGDLTKQQKLTQFIQNLSAGKLDISKFESL